MNKLDLNELEFDIYGVNLNRNIRINDIDYSKRDAYTIAMKLLSASKDILDYLERDIDDGLRYTQR